MWTRFSGHTVIAKNTAIGLAEPLRRRLLPVIPQGNKAFVVYQADVKGKIPCNRMQLIGQREVELPCVFCRNAARYALGSQECHEFRLIPDFEIGWKNSDLDTVRSTHEVPFLAALPPKQWKIVGIHKELRFSFSLDRLKNSIQRLKKRDFGDLLRRPDICWYIHRKHSGGLNLKEIFYMKLDGLQYRLAKFNSPSEFDEKVKTLDL